MQFVILAYISLFILGLSDNIRGPLFPDLLREFALTDFAGSFFFAVVSTAGLIGSLLAPKVLEKWGELHALRGSHILMWAAQIAMFTAPNYTVMLVSCVFFGIAFSMLGVCQNSVVVRYAPADKLQGYQSGLHSMYAASSFIAPLLVTATVSISGSWQSPFLAVAVIGVVMTLSITWIQTREKRSKVIRPAKEKESRLPWKEGVYFAAAMGMYVAAEIMLSTRIALYAQRQWGSSFEHASLFVSAFFVFLFAGRLLFVFWQPKLRIQTQLICALSASVITIVLGITTWGWALSLTGLMMAPIYPLMMTAAAKLFSKQIYQIGAFIVAGSNVCVLTMHGGFGKISDIHGIEIAMWGGAVLCVVSIAMILFYPILFKRSYP